MPFVGVFGVLGFVLNSTVQRVSKSICALDECVMFVLLELLEHTYVCERDEYF